ncbi:Hypothetical protein R9X50_00646500 [Acrodontium crateriforme]|uniref:Uncharacterized protein n=1 Tax=Acrodontium crateriforme TaxID=150365 RepID=A0AAQ3RDM5_9PEZI|nr:Hypothetical protein R9X50_00646500 [Acrodontium crateriforme]
MKTAAVVVAAAGLAAAQGRPSNESICDYYTTALLKTNNATTQETLLTLVVNTAVIGNYTMPNVGIAVPGILAKGTVNGTDVNLLPYFSGMLASTNGGGSKGISVNFLDGGAATPLMKNMPADDTTSAQYTLLTHLYSYFGGLLGCSQFGKDYSGSTNMYEVHKFMDLSAAEVAYFIEQVGLSAASFGVAKEDYTAVGMALNDAFGYRCSEPASIPASAKAEPQSICTDDTCPLAAKNDCSIYATVSKPMAVNSTMSASGTMAPTASASSTSVPVQNAASGLESTFAAGVAGLLGAAAWFL